MVNAGFFFLWDYYVIHGPQSMRVCHPQPQTLLFLFPSEGQMRNSQLYAYTSQIIKNNVEGHGGTDLKFSTWEIKLGIGSSMTHQIQSKLEANLSYLRSVTKQAPRTGGSKMTRWVHDSGRIWLRH